MRPWYLSLFFIGVFAFLPAVPLRAFETQSLTQLAGRQAVTFADGVELILVLMQIEKKYPDFDSRKEFLTKTGILPAKWNAYGASDPLRRGELAYMVVKMLRLEGGLKAHLFGMNRRFAMEELIHEGIMREGHGQDLMTGTELVQVMTQALDFMLRRGES